MLNMQLPIKVWGERGCQNGTSSRSVVGCLPGIILYSFGGASCFATGSAFTGDIGGGGGCYQGFNMFNMVNVTLYSAVFQIYSNVTDVNT